MLDPARAAKAEIYALSTGFSIHGLHRVSQPRPAAPRPAQRSELAQASVSSAATIFKRGLMLALRLCADPHSHTREGVSGENSNTSASEEVVVRGWRRHGMALRTYAA